MNALRIAIFSISTVLLSASVQQADAASCELMKIFAAVKPLESNTDVAACMAATGYEMLPPSVPPTDAQVTKLCGISSCQSVFTALQKMDIPDCTIDILGGLNVKQVFAGIVAKCGGPITGTITSTTPLSSTTPTVTVAKSTTQASQPLAAATTAPPASAPATTSTPATMAAPAKATTATASSTPAMAPSKTGASTGVASAVAEPTLAPQMCL